MTEQNGQTQTQEQTQLEARNPVDAVAQRVREFIDGGTLHLPDGYSAENALKSAWLTLQNVKDKNGQPALVAATQASVYNSLLDMVVQGLNPAKDQGYFIVYGRQLAFQRSYFGDMALVQRIHPEANIWYDVIYEGDIFEFTVDRGEKFITKHEQKFENIDPSKIRGAYCVVEIGDKTHTEIMTIEQIRQSWKRNPQYNPAGGNTPHHTEPDQMALRTVIRRTCKPIINSSSDSYLLHHIQRSEQVVVEAEMDEQVATDANGEVIDVDYSVDGEQTGDSRYTDAEMDAIDAAESEAAASVEPVDAEQASLGGPGF